MLSKLSQQPRLIQRCELDRRKKRLNYQYMGSAEFEFGDQSKSLRRMFQGTIEIRSCTIRAFDNDVEFYLVARSDFPFAEYKPILQGLVNQNWRTKQPTFLDLIVKKKFGLYKNKLGDFAKTTTVWFDFYGNDVLFTLSKKDAEFLVIVLADVKETWRKRDEWLNSPPVKKFQKELEKLKVKLRKAGKNWSSLDRIEEKDGEITVWLNASDRMGSYTLQGLRDWLNEKS